MNFHAAIALAYHGLELRCPAANLGEDRPLTAADCQLLTAWAIRHRKLARADHSAGDLLELGHEIFGWLNGPAKFLERLRDSAPTPLLIQFATGREDVAQARCFLDAPWELIAQDGQHWALRGDTAYCPVRRIGDAVQPPPASPARLSLVFMAAAPRGVANLNYEAEEASILTATRDLGLDLVVEESGELGLLSACVAREKPDVIQISCHGQLEPEPGLLLEDETGALDLVNTSRLVRDLANHHPRLLFLSACETAEADPVLDSLARSLVRSGAPSVLGWAAPVLDSEATIFAGRLYARLTAGDDLAHAVAYARLDLGESEQLPQPPRGGPRSRHWHLARLYFNSAGGGALATADGPRRNVGRGHALKTFLDTKGKQVPVAGEMEFVGRRREIQKILREFRAQASERRAGVLVHGLGRQGKSSLAARLAHRLERTHELIVLFGRYDAPAILTAFRDRLGTPSVAAIVNRHLPMVAEDPRNLLTALTELLEGPCEQQRKDADGRIIARPVLLVIDDFEQALEERKSGRHVLKADFIEPIRAVIRAFNDAGTDSRLLFTSRFQFTLPAGATDLADLLLDLPLHGMDSHEARKQATARVRLESADLRRRTKNLPALRKELDRIIAAARGNPGLQDLLFSLCLEDPAACNRCLAQMEDFHRSGQPPGEDKVRQFLENLAIDALLGLLTPAQRELLRAGTAFDVPVPFAVFQLLAQDGIARLVALGLLEIYEDLSQPQEQALAVNALVRPVAGVLSDAGRQELATLVTAELFERWGGETGGSERSFQQDYELTRLALLASAPRVLAATGADTLRYLDKLFEYRQAAAWAKQIVTKLDASGIPASVPLLRNAAERCEQVGEVKEAGVFRERAMAEIQRLGQEAGAFDPIQHGVTLLAHARALSQQGQPDEALRFLDQARALFPPGREQAIVLGDIARLRAAKGEVDAALQLHQEELAVYEGLGDKRSRAVTLGDIARLRADKGEVDAALQLHQEELAVYEGLGDKRSRAVTLGDIARLRAAKGEVDAALQLHQERLGIFEGLGDKRERAVTLGDIARLRAAKGEVDAALQLHQERLAVYEALGDKAGVANTLWSIAQIELNEKKFRQAYEHLTKSYEILLRLGRLDGICAVGLDLGQLLCAAGQPDEGRKILTRSRDGFAKLGRPDRASQAQALLDRCSSPSS
jgi:tetratricopeptide (TPR) repeat protein